MVIWNTSAAAHDMRPSVILLLKSDQSVLNNKQYCAQQAAFSIFLSCVVVDYLQFFPNIFAKFKSNLCQSRPQSEFVALPLLWDTRGCPAI